VPIVEHNVRSWTAGCAGYIGTALLFEGWKWPLSCPRKVVTFSNFSSASVSSLISVYRLPFVNFLCVSAELWVILNTFVITKYFAVFLVIKHCTFLSQTYLATERLWVCNVQTERESGLESNTAQ